MPTARRTLVITTTTVLGLAFAVIVMLGGMGAQSVAASAPETILAQAAPPPAISFIPTDNHNPFPANSMMAAPELPLSGPAPVLLDAAPRPRPATVETSPKPARLTAPNSIFTVNSVFSVVNTNDSGAGSLRDAVTQANTAAGHDQIEFSLSGCPCVITLLSEVVISDSLTVNGPGANLLTLSGNNANRIFATTAGTPLNVSALTLENGYHASLGGGAISAGDLTLSNVIVRRSNAPFGGGVYTSGALTLVNTTFFSNTAATGGGGGAYVGQNLVAADSTFSKNSAYSDGGGAYVNGLATITGGSFEHNQTTQVKNYGGGGGLMVFNISTITGALFTSNTTSAWGGGAYLANSPAGAINHIRNVTFSDNQSAYGGGGLFQWFSAFITDTQFIANQAGTQGGGLYAGYAGSYSIQMTGGLIFSNTANAGGGLYSDSSIALQGVTIDQNLATNGRGGGAATQLNAFVSDSTFSNNQITAGGHGGGLSALVSAAITDTQFLSNTVQGTYGGGGLAVGSTQGMGSASLLRVTFSQNSNAGGVGGGMLSYGTTQIVDSIFKSNTSWNDGGGAWVGGPLTISAGRFERNQTLLNESNGGGGGLMSYHRTVIEGTQFISNTTADWGGGAYIYNPYTQASSVFTDVTFTGNTATTGGGGGMFSWFTVTLTAPTFTDNYAGWRGGGLYAGYAGNYPPSVDSGLFQHNSAAGGGGLFSDSDITLNHVDFYTNTSRSGNGGAVWSARSATVSDANIAHNLVITAGNSGGIDTANSITLTNSTLFDNRNLIGDGGGSGAGGNATVIDSQYISNTARGSGGGLLAFGNVRITNSSFISNTAGNLGGAIFSNNADLNTSQLRGNLAQSNWGGGIFVNNSVVATDTDFILNTAQYAGGGMGIQYGSGRLTGGRFEANRALTGGWGGAIYDGGPSLIISGTHFYTNTGTTLGGAIATNALTVTGSLFNGNHTDGSGGALQVFGPTHITSSQFQLNTSQSMGGAIWAGTNLYLNDTVFIQNTSVISNGGAIAGQGLVDVSLGLFLQNSSAANGGAIYTNGQINLQRASFIANQANDGGAVYQNAGGGSIVNVLFARNHAVSSNGEALYLKPTTALSIQYSTVASPTLAAGSAIFINGGAPTLLNSIVTSHTVGIVQAAGSLGADYNLFFGNTVNSQGSVTNNHPATGQPGFFDPGLDDYHLGAGSAAVNAGPNIGVSVDFDGDARPQGSGYDLGYDEVAAPESLTAHNDGPTELGNSTHFSASITFGTAVTYLWDFDDGATGSGNAPSHTYAAPGVYHVTVTAANGGGSINASTTVAITDNPVTGLTASNSSPTPLGIPTAFTATVTSGSSVSYAWNFGDGQTSSGPLVSHTYSAAGDFTVTVTATNSVSSLAVTTTAIIEQPISGLAATSNSPVVLGKTSQFTATLASGSRVSYTWDFGNGGHASGSVVTHTYGLTGAYPVTVTAENLVSVAPAFTAMIIVAPVQAGFTATPVSGTAPLEVTFTNTSVGDFVSCAWTFGDGETSNVCAPAHIFAVPGVYTVALTVSGPGGTDLQTKVGYITVRKITFYVYLPVVESVR